MSVLYPGWGSAPVIQTKDWMADLYVNPGDSNQPADLSLVQFVPDPDFGHAFATTMKVTDDWQPVDGKLFAGPLLKADSYPTAPGDFYVRVPVKGPALEPVSPGRGFLAFEFESFPFGGSPQFSINITADPAITNDGSNNHWYLGLDASQPHRFDAWIGPRVIPGQPIYFDVHYVVSKDPAVGGCELWCNTVKQTFWDKSSFLHFPTLVDGLSNQGPHRLVLCSYSGIGSGGTPFTKPATVLYGAPVFGTTLADVQPPPAPAHTYGLSNQGQSKRTYGSFDEAVAAAKPILTGGKAVFLTRES